MDWLRMRAAAGTAAALGVALTGACIENSAADAAHRLSVAVSEVRDSAGIRIVDNRLTAGAVAQQLGAPLVEIGALDGEPAYQLHRVESVTRLSDGRIVASNSGTELRYFDAAGRYLRTTGRSGDGPGEYRSIRYIRSLPGDSVLVFDANRRRISIVDPDGEYERDFASPAAADGMQHNVVAALADGTLLAARTTNMPTRSISLLRDTSQFTVVDTTGAVRSLGDYPGSDRKVNITESGGTITSVEVMRLPFSRAVFTAASRDFFHIASNESWELHVYDGAGLQRMVVRRTDSPPRAVSAHMVSTEIERQLTGIRERAEGSAPVDLAGHRRRLEALPHVETLPAYAAVTAVQSGGVWVREYVLPADETATATWSVFDEDGQLAGQVEMPAGFRPMYIDDDVVIGVIRDDFDVEYVRVYAVPGPGST